MVYAVAILLISALTTVGLIATWAATSPGNWFWRTMAFLGAMSPLLLIPAYEPFVAFVIQGAVVAAGVQVARWRRARKSGEPFFTSRYSVKTVLLAMVPTAVLAAVVVRLPGLNFLAWRSVVLIGLGGGAATLAALWIVDGKSANGKVRSLLALLIVSAISLAPACGDYFIIAMHTRWPPEPAAIEMISHLANYPNGVAVLVWTPILLAITVLVAVGASILRSRRKELPIGRTKRSLQAIGITLLGLNAVPAAFVYWLLVSPLPIPTVVIPNPNGYDDFQIACEMLPARLLVNSATFDAEIATEQKLQQASDEVAPALNRVRQGLKKQVMTAPDYTSQEFARPEIMNLRSLARGFEAQGYLFLKQDNSAKAAGVFVDGARFSVLLSHGGLTIDDILSVVCTGVVCRGLYAASRRIPIEDVPDIILAISNLEAEREPAEDFAYRDRVRTKHAYGWSGLLIEVFRRLSGNESLSMDDYVQARNRELATLRLLQLELALRLYEHDHGKHPESLDALVPKYIASIPVDPMSPEQESLRYVEAESGIVPYSVGMNGVDDQGQADPDNPTFGDLRLDVLWAPQPAANQQATTNLPDDSDPNSDSNEEN